MRARKASHSSNSSWRLQFSRWLQFCHGAGWIKFCARAKRWRPRWKRSARLCNSLINSALTRAPAVRVHQNQLQIARHFDVSGQAPRVQLIRYYRQGQRMIRAASPLLESRAALHSALAEPVSVEAGWSAVTLMRDTLAFNVRIWMPKLGWGDQMSATQRPASPTKDSA